jgi:predicted nucleic acid-binding protein
VTASAQAVLDACVLVNAALRDTLLRIGEPPPLYLPRWSKTIMDQMTRTLEGKLGLSSEQTARLVGELSTHFADCWIDGYEELIPAMTNDLKDRHVLAAAVRAKAPIIVTFNIKHFTAQSLAPWKVKALTPDAFLVEQLTRHRSLVVKKLHSQAADRGGMERLLSIHAKTVPSFTTLVVAALTGQEGA